MQVVEVGFIEQVFTEILPEVLPAFEERPQQVEMALAVENALAKGRHLAVEAGTGVGKSLAYLIPAVHWALQNDQRVVVSTHTTALQDQQLHKDVPVVHEVFGKVGQEFKAVVVKGRGNYICLRRLYQTQKELAVDPAGVKQLALEASQQDLEQQCILELIQFLHNNRGHSGEKSRFPVNVLPIWGRICGESDFCIGRLCRHGADCFINKARRRQNEAQLLLVNHALFFSDLSLRHGGGKPVLPDYGRAVFDEAHHLEDVATRHLGVEVSFHRVNRLMLDLTAGNNQVAQNIRLDEKYYEKFKTIKAAVDQKAEDFFKCLEKRLDGKSVLRYREAMKTPLVGELEKVYGAITDDLFVQSLNLSEEGQAELEAISNRCATLVDDLKYLLNPNGQEDTVYWLEGGESYQQVTIKSVPITVAGILTDSLFERVPVVLTSATISTNGNFTYLAGRLGLEHFDGLIVGSPFDYKKQSLLFVPNKVVDPRDSQYDDYISSMCQEILVRTAGRAFVLFTSYRSMNYCFQKLLPWLEEQDFTPLLQGQGESPHVLLQRFKESERPVLFGTNSFWEGVDVQGDQLSCVILTKLPFAVPTEPVEEARVEKIRSQNRNDFMEYTVPKAVIRLKQGFGRLIRTAGDRGVVAILDPRIITKPYGKVFLNSLPPTQRNRALAAIERFFYQSSSEASP